MKFSLVAVAALLIPLGLFAQEFRGTLSGTVTDPSSSAIAGAKITVTEVNTGTKNESLTDSGGQYTAPFLLPGDYDISAQFQGFKAYTRKALHLGAGDRTVIDIRLEVGDTTQTVLVTADAPQLNTENASAGQSITTKEVEDLPLNGGTPMALAALSLGVIATGQPGLIHPFDSGAAAGFSVAGGYAQTSELQIDGSPDATWDGRLAFSVPKDAVQELRVKAFDSDAANGHSGGGTLNQVLKTGTNQFHGSLWEQNEPNSLTANDFFNNAKGVARPVTHFNQYGVTAGAPVYIPKLIDGRNKLFVFFAYEAIKDGQPAPTFTTVPTAAERTGDFSAVLAADGPSAQLYDPYSGTLNGTTVSRTPYPNNKIPSAQLNPIALSYLQFYPQPNITAVRPDGFQNFGSSATTNDDYNNQLGRVDYNMSDKSRMYFNIRRSGYNQVKNNFFGNEAEGSVLYRNNWGGTLDEVYTINSSNVIDIRANFTRMAEIHASPSQGFNPTQLGFPSYLAGNSDYLQLPIANFSSNSNFQALGATGASTLPSQSGQLFGTYLKIKGNHILKIGGDLRQYRLNTFTAGNSTGTMSFSGNSWVRSTSAASSTVVLGQDFSSFLLGLPYSATYDLNTSGSWYSYYGSGFIQDDWRVKSNLTINWGVRFDHDGPYHETYGRTVDGFNTTSPSPLAAAAQAAYAAKPNAYIPASAFNPMGGLTFASPGNNTVYQNKSHIVSPRVGFAWTPDVFKGKTVIRGAFGVFVAPVTIADLAITGAYSTNPLINQEGFSQSTAIAAPSTTLLNPSQAGAISLSNPFPNGIARPSGSSAGLATYAGQAVSFIDPNMQSPYSLRWNFDIQQSLTPNTMLEVLYIGNHSLHLPISFTQLNGIPQQYLSTLGVRDPSVAYLATPTVSNPFSGLATSQNASTATVAQLLARYPQFPVGDSATGWSGSTGVLEDNLSAGSSYFESLNVRMQRRLSNGLNITGNFIKSRLIEQDSWLNSSDGRPEKRISPTDRTNRFVLAATYQLPVGKGKALQIQSRFANALFGGWVLTTIFQYQSGAPITWANGSTTSPGDYVYFGGPLGLDARGVNGTAFNTKLFDTAAADAFNYHLRNFPTTFNNLRADGINQLDASVLKRFNLGEKRRFELRGEAYNLPNHPVFAAPSTTASSSGFGTITATANRFRTFQLVARFYF
jgi:hypothetical protein